MPLKQLDLSAAGFPIPVELIAEDEWLLAINKPAGLLSIPDGYDKTKPFVSALLSPLFGRLWVVHRLDRDTSGVFLLARSEESHRRLNALFAARQIRKVYEAIVWGHPEWQSTTVTAPLRVNGDRQHRTVVDHDQGKPAVTLVNCLSRFSSGWSFFQVEPQTGYTHQIRSHLSWIGHPLAADPLYRIPRQSPAAVTRSNPPSLVGINRTALHARRLSFTHPFNGEQTSLLADYPPDFSDTLKNLQA